MASKTRIETVNKEFQPADDDIDKAIEGGADVGGEVVGLKGGRVVGDSVQSDSGIPSVVMVQLQVC
jgi:hypothetical protein